MKNEFKAGDLVFELDFYGGIKLEVLERKSIQDEDFCTLITRHGFDYSQCGRAHPSFKVPHLLHATQEMREKLVAIWGEDAVPKMPLRGSELTRELLKKQKYVLCWANTRSDEYARDASRKVYIVTEVEDDGFTLSDGGFAEFAVPVDEHGYEITEIE